MGMYGVEEEFWVSEYHFEVNFSNDYAVGHGPRDIWVARRCRLRRLHRNWEILIRLLFVIIL